MQLEWNLLLSGELKSLELNCREKERPCKQLKCFALGLRVSETVFKAKGTNVL